jgi:integrase
MSEERLILEGSAFDNFINAVRAKATKKLYLVGLRKFMAYNHIDNISSLLQGDARLIEAKIISWIVHLRDNEKLTPTSVQVYLAGIMTFYKMNDIEPRRHKINKYLPEDQKIHDDRAYTTAEIARILEHCDLRVKAAVLLLASSGIRIGALSELKVKHLTKIEKYNLYKLKVYAGFTKYEHFTFSTPEAATAMDAYFEYRQRYGEKINPDAPVIREEFDRDDLLLAKHPRKLGCTHIGDLIYHAAQRAGIFEITHMIEGQKTGQKRNDIPRAHGFRKFFETNLVRAKLQEPIPEMLLGHDIGLKKHYLRLSEEEIMEEYTKAVDFLTINEESRLKKKVQEMTTQSDRLDNLQEQIEMLGQKLGLG